MSLPAAASSVYALVAYLHAAIGSSYAVHGLEMPPGWALANAVLVLPDGGPARTDIPVVEERFTLHSYGTTAANALTVDLAAFRALHRAPTKSATITAGTVYIPTAYRIMGPSYLVDPGTEWPRVISSYMVVLSEWATS